MTEEQNEQLKQIREHQKRRSNALFQNGRSPMSDSTYAETEFLLSLVDRQVADMASVENYVADVKRELGMRPNTHLSISLDRYRERAATSMRSACIERVEKDLKGIETDKLYRTSQGWHSNDIAHAFRELIAALSSITIQEQK